MKHRIVAVLAFLSIAALSEGVLVAQQREPVRRSARVGRPGRQSGTTSIVGRIVDPSTNSPVRRAQLEAFSDVAGSVFATTDDEGLFRLEGLSAGAWRVTASKAGYFTWQLGQRRPFESPSPTRLATNQVLSVEIPLTRGGAIAGRVYDETGEPLAGLKVRAYRTRMSQGVRRLESVGASDQTDDTGAYRLYGLPPGDYYLAASLRVAPADSLVETTYAPTYYPGTGDLAEAQRIRLGLGGETNATFSLLPIRHVRISGLVLASSGGPANVFLNLASDSAEFGVPVGLGGVTRDDGTFTLPDVPPGHYTLTVSSRGDGPTETASFPLTVGSEDLDGLTLVTGRAATIHGRFVTDTGVSRPIPGGLDVVATAARAGGAVMNSGSGTSFELSELTEAFYLRVDGLPAGWAVKAILVNGLDVTDTKVVLAAAQDAEARIVLTDHATEITGILPVPARSDTLDVIVFPEDSSKWTFPSRYVRMARADQRGRFQITGLPSGERYLAVATNYLEDGESNDPEFLERMREVAVRFPLEEAEKRALDLTVMER